MHDTFDGKTSVRRLPNPSRRWLRDDRGAVAAIAAIAFPVLIGAMGLGAETGFWYQKQRKLQHAADVSAHAAAVRHRAGDGQTELESTALRIARASGYSPGDLTVGTMADASAGSTKVTVQLSESHERMFSSVFSTDPVVLAARAVAEIKGGSKACVLALSGSAPGAVTVTGSTEINLSGCSVVSNSNAADAFLMKGGSALLSTDCVYTVGEAVITTGLHLTGCSAPVEGVPPTADPFASVVEPDKLHVQQLPCRTLAHISTSTYTFDRLASGIDAIRFCGGLEIKGTIALKPGLYVIDGGELTITAGANLSGDGITFYFTNSAAAKLLGNADVDLSAPTSGPFSGLLFFGSRRDAGVVHQITGNSQWSLDGNLYAPTGHIEFTGNTTVSGGCTQIVADRITFTGNSALSTCASPTKEITVGRTVSLIE
ncbi:Von Willebrand factor type A domain protein, associated with Flp pilus assembly (plasmid) [Sinorhizobium sojae CCBAU 05684]|uniref:von Willebrand factor type A domain protein, associated with Flp pilus assembly n=1 Tax=Sinorhizobium sojae CCBAU 05684 TaxID=716928 RepID=A0A249PHS3_9HYPH|nr:pilus assembly protein TadG-related protein [Sinorhizobium sojae]ASY65490.1 Von Willebrand factor type A domain protein, associated with Flp pilus assembly [Sinorhizobium sojae CCBAU 05684]